MHCFLLVNKSVLLNIVYVKLFLGLLFSLVVVVHAVSAFDPSLSNPTSLPRCPRRCIIHVYGPLKEVPSFLPPEAKIHANWTEYYKACGVSFPKGGFAFFYKPTRTLIIATTKADFDLIETVVSGR